MHKRKNGAPHSQNGHVTQNGTRSKLSSQKSSKLSTKSKSSLPQSTKTTVILVIIVTASFLVIFQDNIVNIFSNQTSQNDSKGGNTRTSNSKITSKGSLNGGWKQASQKVLEKYGTSLCTVDRKSVSDLTNEEFEQEYRFKKPLIVTFPKGASDWTDPQKWSISSLKKKYGEWSVFSGNSRDIVRGGGRGDVQSSFTEFVDKHLDEKDIIGEPFYIFDREFYQDSSLPKTLKPPQYFQIKDDLHDSIFFLGASGSGVSFHKHADAWNGVIYGRKRWFLYPIQQTPPGGVYPGFTQNEWFEQIYPYLNQTNKPMECIQEAGRDTLFEGTYHGTINLGDTVAIGIQKKLAAIQEEKIFYEDIHITKEMGGSKFAEEIKALKDRRTELFEKLLELLPDNTEVKMKIGQLYSDYGRTDDGIIYTQKAIEIDPSFVIAHLNKGNMYKKLGKNKEAEECYKTALTLSPKLWDIYAAYGDFLVDTNRAAEAIPIYKKGIELKPNLVGFWVHLKTAQEKAGDKDGAQRSQLHINMITKKMRNKNH